MKRIAGWGLISMAILAIVVCGFSTTAGAESAYAPQVVLVKFNTRAAPRHVRALVKRHSLRYERTLSGIGVVKFTVPRHQHVPTVARYLSRYDLIDFAEPDYVRQASYVPNDPKARQQWDMTQIGMVDAWDITRGAAEVITAILDTGIDLDHPDLIDQLWRNTDEIGGNGIDDDENGYVDDVVGYDFAGDGAFPLPDGEDSVPDDKFVGHGSHVSGTVAARQDNGIGITGIAPLTKLMAVRVLGGILGSGYSSDIVDGIVYAVDNGAQVINMSLGGTSKSLSEYSALKYAWENNVFVAAAAGNSGDSGNPIEYPGGYVFAMSVGASGFNDEATSFSTHNSLVEISAPGVEVLSTVPGGEYEFVDWSGTSMATPHVAGVAALLKSLHPDIANWEIRIMLQDGTQDNGSPGWDTFGGYGRLHAPWVLGQSRPNANALRIITPQQGSILLSGTLASILWNPVNGAASYRLTATLPSGAAQVIPVTDTHYTVHPRVNLPFGNYTITVEALNDAESVIATDSVGFLKI